MKKNLSRCENRELSVYAIASQLITLRKLNHAAKYYLFNIASERKTKLLLQLNVQHQGRTIHNKTITHDNNTMELTTS